MDEYISREETVKKIEEKLKVDDLMSLAEEVWTNNCLKIVLRAIMAVETAYVQPVDRWISVNDKLPEQDENVLVFTKDKDIMTMIYKVIPFRWYKPKFGGFDKDYVTHWKPRPEPPKDGDTK